MKRIQRGSEDRANVLFISSFKLTPHLVSVPAVVETLLQLINAPLCGGGDSAGDRGTEGETARDNESWWDLKGKGGVGEEKELSYSQQRGPNSCCCEPHFISAPSRLATRNLQILKTPCLPHCHMQASSTTLDDPFSLDNRHGMPLRAAREKTLVLNSVDATTH